MSPVWIYIALVMATDKVSDGGRVAFDGVLEEKDGEVLWKHLLKLDPSMSPEEFQTEGKWDLEELREEIRIILRDVDFLEGKEQIDLKLDPPSPEPDLPQWSKGIERQAEVLAMSLRAVPSASAHDVEGYSMYRRRVKKELEFLKRGSGTEAAERGCNIPHLYGVHMCLESLPSVVAVGRSFSYRHGTTTNPRVERVPVDVVCGNGKIWVKVWGRMKRRREDYNSGFASTSSSTDSFDPDVVKIASRLMACAALNKNLGRPPKVVYACFPDSLRPQTQEHLDKLGVTLIQLTQDGEEPNYKKKSALGIHHFARELRLENSKATINLDVTTLVALCSNLCNSTETDLKALSRFRAKNNHVRFLAEDEIKHRAKKIILDVIKNRKVVVCETAKACVERIFETVGGKEELERLPNVLRLATIVKDQPSERVLSLPSKKLKRETKVIFGTGDSLKALTLTSNAAFVRSARQYGLNLNVKMHPARALIGHIVKKESKQNTTTKTSSSSSRPPRRPPASPDGKQSTI
ncbi:hypothetical protein AAMO2058_000995000 [Amorphochlora amoebiformis]